MPRTSAWILSAAVLSSLASFGLADAPAATETTDISALKAQIDALQKQVETVQQQQAQQAEVNATTAALAADAAKQSTMLQTAPFTAGYSNGFKIQSVDGNFVLQPGLGPSQVGLKGGTPVARFGQHEAKPARSLPY